MILDSHTLWAGRSIYMGSVMMVETACIDPPCMRVRTPIGEIGRLGKLPTQEYASTDNSTVMVPTAFCPRAGFSWEAIVH